MDDLAALEALADGAGGSSDATSAPEPKRPRTLPGSSSAPASATAAHLEVEPVSGLRIDLDPKTRRLSRADVAALTASFAVKRMHELPALMRGGPAPAAWLTIGCLVDKGPAKESKRGNFCVWKLSNLGTGGMTTTVSVFIFGEAYSNAWKEVPGSVFALLTPRIVPPKEGSADGTAALSVEKQQQLQRIGQSCDFGLCRGERRDGKPCTMWVNLNECQFCEYHASAALRHLEQAQRVGAKRAGGASNRSAAANAALSGVTAVPGLATFSAPADSGVPKGLAPQTRPGWSAANVAPSAAALGQKSSIQQQADAVAVLKMNGWKIEEPDPNSLRPFGTMVPPSAQHAKPQGVAAKQPMSAAPPASQRIAKPQGASSSKQGQAQGGVSGFEKAFGGRLPANSSEGQRALAGRATHAEAERDGSRKVLDKRLDHLAKKDALSEKVQQVNCMEVTAHRCELCGYLAERVGAECKAAGHQTQRMKLKKRGFSCAKCRNHITVLNQRWPKEACSKCHANQWKDAALRRESSAPTPASGFLPRGEELGKFRGSAPQQAAAERPPMDAPARGGRSSDPNLWQGSIPDFDVHS